MIFSVKKRCFPCLLVLLHDFQYELLIVQHQVAVARVLFAIWSRTCREEDLKLGGTAAQVAHLKAVAAEPLRQAPAGARARRSQRLAARRKRNLRISVPCRSIDTIQSS